MRVVKRDHLMPKDEVNNIAVTDVLGLPRQSIKLAKWSYKALEPSYCVLVDSGIHCVVLSFRGSLSDADFLTDACGTTSPFCGGVAHQGMSDMVKEMCRGPSGDSRDSILLQCLSGLLVANPDYGLLVTGHSLGAGLCSLFAVMVLHERPSIFFETVPNFLSRFKCVAFAPPPVLSLPLAGLFDAFVTSVVAGNDLVPRLQLNTIDRLALEIRRQTPSVGTPDDPNNVATAMSEELHVVGKVWLLTSPTHPKKNRATSVPRTHAILHQVFLHSNAIANHLMDHYAAGLQHIHNLCGVKDSVVTGEGVTCLSC
jgi:hypothetical protein